MNEVGITGPYRPDSGLVIAESADSVGGAAEPPLGKRVSEDLLYLGFQGRFLEASVRRLVRSGVLDSGLADFGVDVRATVIARAMVCAPDGRGDLCHPGLLSLGPTLAFGATPLEFLRHVAMKGTAPAAARTGGLSWTDVRRGMIGWGGARGGMMTQVFAGAALAFTQRGEDRVALVFEEHAALEAGGWHEGMNMASALRSPLIVVVQHAFRAESSDSPDVEAVAASYGAAFARVAGDTHERVFRTAASARRRAVSGEGPTLIELVPLSGERIRALHDDFAAQVVAEGGATESALDAIEKAAAAGVDHATARLEKEPGPAAGDALAPVRTDAVPLVPWTRRDPPSPAPPSPAGEQEAADAG